MIDSHNRLKKGNISFGELYRISFDYYSHYDDKDWRARLDVISSRLITRKNFVYNQETKQWEETNKRHIRFDFVVSTDPVSYKKSDTIKTHKYPVSFLFYDLSGMGFNSPFKWRTGSQKRFISTPKGASKEQRLKITNLNITNGVQVQFLMELMWILRQYDLLFGIMTCLNRPPNITNKKLIPFFDKHAYYLCDKVFLPLMKNEKFLINLNQIVKND